jgi:hypothetical protein
MAQMGPELSRYQYNAAFSMAESMQDPYHPMSRDLWVEHRLCVCAMRTASYTDESLALVLITDADPVWGNIPSINGFGRRASSGRDD